MFTNKGSRGSLSKDASGGIESGEVLDVCTGIDHPFFDSITNDDDGVLAGWVKVKILGSRMGGGEEEGQWVAPLNKIILTYPVKGEIVLLITAAGLSSQYNPKDKDMYWLTPISVYGDINSNMLPNVSFSSKVESNDSPGDTFKEKSVPQLQHMEGDTIIQSRWNNGIRFGSTALISKPSNTWSIGSSDGDPILSIINGYNAEEKTHVEDVNKEDSIIVMTSTQKIDLAPANPISPQIVPVPTGPAIPQLPINTYMGKPQVIINSDRLIFNAKKDNIIISAKKDVSISTSKWKLNMTALADILYSTLEQLTMEIHPTPCGPTGPPLNAAIYAMLKAQMDQMKN